MVKHSNNNEWLVLRQSVEFPFKQWWQVGGGRELGERGSYLGVQNGYHAPQKGGESHSHWREASDWEHLFPPPPPPVLPSDAFKPIKTQWLLFSILKSVHFVH